MLFSTTSSPTSSSRSDWRVEPPEAAAAAPSALRHCARARETQPDSAPRYATRLSRCSCISRAVATSLAIATRRSRTAWAAVTMAASMAPTKRSRVCWAIFWADSEGGAVVM